MDVEYYYDLEFYCESIPVDKSASFLYDVFSYSYNHETNNDILFEAFAAPLFQRLAVYCNNKQNISLEGVKTILDDPFLNESRNSFKASSIYITIPHIKYYFFNALALLSKFMYTNVITVHRQGFKTKKEIVNDSLFFNVKPTSTIFKNLIKKSKKKLHSQISTHLFQIKPVNITRNTYINLCANLLRKTKVFTKSKYSRSRQYCKNIVLLGLLLNIILMFGLNSGYYAIIINFGYFPEFFYITAVVYSVFVTYKHKLYDLEDVFFGKYVPKNKLLLFFKAILRFITLFFLFIASLIKWIGYLLHKYFFLKIIVSLKNKIRDYFWYFMDKYEIKTRLGLFIFYIRKYLRKNELLRLKRIVLTNLRSFYQNNAPQSVKNSVDLQDRKSVV